MCRMTQYGQFCPVAKASEIFAERWTPLVLRELLCGTERFSDIRRGVPLMSPSLLSNRLKALERNGIIERRGSPRAARYILTEAGEELRPVVMLLGQWGKKFASDRIEPGDYDVMLLMWDISRRVDASAMPPGTHVVAFDFPDAPKAKRHFWLLARDGAAELCLHDPGHEVGLTLRSSVRTLADIWLGQRDLAQARRANDLELEGARPLIKTLPQWFTLSLFAEA